MTTTNPLWDLDFEVKVTGSDVKLIHFVPIESYSLEPGTRVTFKIERVERLVVDRG